MKPGGRWVLPAGLRRAIIAHARAEAPQECCGLLVGRARTVRHLVPMRNATDGDRRARFLIDPAAHVELQRVLRAVLPPLEVVGVYHSHPRGRARPSETDVAEAFYADWLYVVAGLRPRAMVAAFQIADGKARPVALTTGRAH